MSFAKQFTGEVTQHRLNATIGKINAADLVNDHYGIWIRLVELTEWGLSHQRSPVRRVCDTWQEIANLDKSLTMSDSDAEPLMIPLLKAHDCMVISSHKNGGVGRIPISQVRNVQRGRLTMPSHKSCIPIVGISTGGYRQTFSLIPLSRRWQSGRPTPCIEPRRVTAAQMVRGLPPAASMPWQFAKPTITIHHSVRSTT
jgi:hypothetical protein